MDAIGLMGLANSSSGQHGSFIFPVPLMEKYSFGDGVWQEAARFNTGVSITGCALITQANNRSDSSFEDPITYIELTNQQTTTANTVYTIGVKPHPSINQSIIFYMDANHKRLIRFTYDGTDIVMNAQAQDGGTTFTCEAFFLFIVSY